MNEALASSIRGLNLNHGDDTSQRISAFPSPAEDTYKSFDENEDEGHQSLPRSNVKKEQSTNLLYYRQPSLFTLSEPESDEESTFKHGQFSSIPRFQFGQDTPSTGQSDNEQSFFTGDQDAEEHVGDSPVILESPSRLKIGGTKQRTNLLTDHLRSRIQHRWKQLHYTPDKYPFSSPSDYHPSPKFLSMLNTPSSSSISFEDFTSPLRNGPLGSGPVASLTELYYTPIGGFDLDKNLWPPDERRFIKNAKPPQAPGNVAVGVASVTSRVAPKEFIQAVEYGQKHHNKALSTMIWKKTFVSGNSAHVYGIEINGQNLVLKITKYDDFDVSHKDVITQCVYEQDITALRESSDACNHKPSRGLIQKPSCASDPNLVPFEYYISEKVALTHGLMPAAASVSNTFAKDKNEWYLIYDELLGISPLKYGENILERLAKPLIRQQLEGLKKIANCHIMHLDAHWGNVLYSKERGIQFIDFGIATLVDRFELSDPRAALIVTFTFNRCLDCEASELGRDFQNLVTSHFPVDGEILLTHPWLQY